MSRAWLRHPPRTIVRPRTCPSGRPRFASEWLAVAARAVPPVPGLEAVECDRCGGWHLVAAR